MKGLLFFSVLFPHAARMMCVISSVGIALPEPV